MMLYDAMVRTPLHTHTRAMHIHVAVVHGMKPGGPNRHEEMPPQ